MNSNTATIILTLLCLASAPVPAEPANTAHIKWILTGDSPSLDRSSAALANNQLQRGLRYAHKALDYAREPLAEYLATHNLCMGYLLSARPVQAEPFCASLQAMTVPDMGVTKRGNNTYRVSRRGQLPAARLLQENLQAAARVAGGAIAGVSAAPAGTGPVN